MIDVWVSLPWAGPGAYYGADAAAKVNRLEALGVSGVVQGDHLFLPGPPPDDPLSRQAADALTVLTTVAAHSERLGVATLVANVGFHHPLPLLRKFANLALLHGGHRVYAGLGAGWSRREFEALGIPMPAHRERVARLAETARLARTLFDRGWATQDGAHVSAADLPLAPAAPSPPRLLLGGGSPSLLAMAGRYADHIDLAPPTHRRSDNEFQRSLLTTIEDLAESARTARAAGRPLTTSLLLTAVVVCRSSSVREEEEALCARVGLPWRALDKCPYVLIGEPAQIAERVCEQQERIGLDWLIVAESAIDKFSSDVMSLLA
jgi:alkanesulfonate monooxygenase SsuD/methylene tetrahydromethanopterin reductase-like flavin-dependent oxidoreductase (luciferase family)